MVSDLGPVNPGYGADVEWLHRWRLRAEGDPRSTPSSVLIRARTEDGQPVMLKIAHTDEEVRGSELLAALDGHGVARVLRREGEACLIERATGRRNLVRMVRAGRDDEATRIICEAGMRIHEASAAVLGSDSPPDLVALPVWFRHLLDRIRPQVVFANEEEAELVGQIETETLVVKRGAGGVVVAGEELEARRVAVVDTTGAGDAFAAGFLLGGSELGLDAAARCVATMGAFPP